jgi:hypothetical protein
MTTASRFAPNTPIWLVHNPDENTEPMGSRAQGLGGLLKLSGIVAAAGATLPIEYLELRDRVTDFCGQAAGGSHVLFDRLADALVTGRGDVWQWFAAAQTQLGANAVEQRAELLTQLHSRAEAALRDMYAPHAGPIYAALAAQFDRTAHEFTRAASVVDPAAPAAEVVSADKRTLAAWRDALTLAGRLDELLEPLSAAAELLRGPTLPSGTGVTRDTFLLQLVADTTDLHARVVWHAFRDWPAPRPVNPGESLEAMQAKPTDQPVGTRGGRWSRLLAVGATLRAHPRPQEMVLFGQPAPIGVAPVMAPGERRPRLRRVDPCGPLPDPGAAKRPLMSRLRDALRRTTDKPEPLSDIFDTVLLDDGDER